MTNIMTVKDRTDLLKRSRAQAVVKLIKLYRQSGLDEQTILTQLMSGFGRSFTQEELEMLIKLIK